MQASTYDATAYARALVQDVRVTFDYGQRMTTVMHLSVAELEQMLAAHEITSEVVCLACDEHVADCPEVGPLLVDWPERTYPTTWGPDLTASELA